jgi:hypothetical protein
MKVKKIKKSIGWKEKIIFPDLDLQWVDAKVDTGALTSSLHATHQSRIEREGKIYIQFRLEDHAHPAWDGKELILPLKDETIVKNSFGQEEPRYVVTTRVRIHNYIIRADFTLSDRSNMEFPVLLGRKAIRTRFLVDVARSNLYFKKHQKKIQP